jgi:hypothetical protein
VAELLPTDEQLWTRLHNWGTGEWVRRKDPIEMLRISAGCIEALDAIHTQAREIERLNAKLEKIRVRTLNLAQWLDKGCDPTHGATEASFIALAAKESTVDVLCEHEWVSARNEVVTSGEICKKCYAIRAEGTRKG